jgi:signal transduction histidine kinase
MSVLSRRTVRSRLTLLYCVLFLLSATVLLAITYAVVAQTPPAAEHHATAPPGERLPSLPSLAAQAAAQRDTDLRLLLTGSAGALAAMTVVSFGLGWVLAGRVLRPLRTITAAARRISASSLDQRLALPGPPDELKELGDTFDGLLARLERAFAAQRQFVANASHELRTPLTVLRAHLEATLTDPRPTTESWRAGCERALAAAAHQELLIDALLTLARSEGGLDHPRPTDLADITTRVLHTRDPDIRRDGPQLTSALEPAPVFGDPGLIERLVANLVDNALRHNDPSGWIEVRTGTPAGRPTLSVANSGPLIPAADVARLFLPFQRHRPDRTGHDEGLGLGLSIVDGIAHAHAAEVTAHPRPAGGLTVTVRFPDVRRQTPAVQPGQAESSERSVWGAGG